MTTALCEGISFMTRIIVAGICEGVLIENPNDVGEPISVTIPANMIYNWDYLMRTMTLRGKESAELSVSLEPSPEGQFCWHARYGAFRTWGITAADAVSRLGQCLRDYQSGR